MQEKKIREIPRRELIELAQRCSDFMYQFAAWKHPVCLELNMKDVSFLTERLEEYKQLMKSAKQLEIVNLSAMPRGWWPGFEAKITDERHLVATKLPYRVGEGKSSYRVKGEKYDIAPESLPRFFQSAAGMLINRAHNIIRNNDLTHEPLVTHDSPGGPRGFTLHIS